jgi:uncharacterized membrane protein
MEWAMTSWLLAIPLLGFVTGLRAMTAIAVVCWFGYIGHLPVHHSWAHWTTLLPSTIVFTIFAFGEYIGDKLPKTPPRTAPVGLIARLVFGGLVGAIAATALKGAPIEGILLGALGALLGTFIGYHIRKDIVDRTQLPDWVVAVCEDSLAIILAVFAVRLITE